MTAAAVRSPAPTHGSARCALITGVTGQDGAYLTKLLQGKGYRVVGTSHRARPDRTRLHAVACQDIDICRIEADTPEAIRDTVSSVAPTEIYHLASQSSVAESLVRPCETASLNGMASVYWLEAVRLAAPQTRFFHASSSEIYGVPKHLPQTEDGPFWPTTPYGAAKLFGHQMTRIYREAYSLFTVSGILFNHESPIRGQHFVTAKICRDLALAATRDGPPLALGNLDARRDWGYAAEYVEAMWLSLQVDDADDYVIASGVSHSVRNFVEEAGRALEVDLVWSGHGKDEIARSRASGRVMVKVDERFFRAADNPDMRGSAEKATRLLGWRPKTGFSELVRLLVQRALMDIEHEATVAS